MNTRYEIRTVTAGNVFSTSTNYRLYERRRAQRIVRRIKKSGIDAVIAPVRVTKISHADKQP